MAVTSAGLRPKSDCSGKAQEKLYSKLQTRPLVREGATKLQTHNCLKKISRRKKNWSQVPDGRLTPGQTGRLTVSCNVTSTLTSNSCLCLHLLPGTLAVVTLKGNILKVFYSLSSCYSTITHNNSLWQHHKQRVNQVILKKKNVVPLHFYINENLWTDSCFCTCSHLNLYATFSLWWL
jgi:hypothetical protein